MILTNNEVERDLYLRYGLAVQLRDNYDNYDLEKKYVFIIDPSVMKYNIQEKTFYLKDVLYRNIYWMNSEYKQNAIYENILRNKKGYKKSEIEFLIKTQDNREVSFIPAYYNEKTLTFIHCFDSSWFTSNCDNENTKLVPTTYLQNILDYFANDKEFTLEYYIDYKCCEYDYH